jgi:DNA-binding IclR family transcriptional regulator
MAARNHIEVVEKTLKMMEALAESEQPCSLTSLAQRLGLVKSSAFRILYTLKSLGYVEQTSEGGPYRLTLKVVALSRHAAGRPTLLSVARPYLSGIRDELHEAVWLAEWRQGGVIIVDEAPVSRPLQLSLDIGDRCPLHASAAGKAIAAQMPRAQLEAALGTGPLPRFTRRTIISRSKLALELAKVRHQGFATNQEETIEGAILVGAPIFDSQGTVFAALSVSCPSARCTPDKRRQMVRASIKGARSISADLAILRFHRRNRPEDPVTG